MELERTEDDSVVDCGTTGLLKSGKDVEVFDGVKILDSVEDRDSVEGDEPGGKIILSVYFI